MAALSSITSAVSDAVATPIDGGNQIMRLDCTDATGNVTYEILP